MNAAINILLETVNRQRLNPVIKGEYRNVTELVTQANGRTVCPYCNETYEALGGLYQHIRFRHGLSAKDVFDNLCKKETDGYCIICGKPTLYKYGRYLLTCSKACKAEWVRIDERRARKISLGNRKYNTESFIEKARSIHGDKFDYAPTHVGILHDRIDVICKMHGLFNTVACYHLEDMWGGCRKCASESMIATKDAWSNRKKEEVKNTRRKTNLERFGCESGPSPFGSEEYISIIRKRFGVENPFSSKEVQAKIRETNLAKYGVTNPAYLEKTKRAGHTKQANRKRYLTHKKNNSFNASKPEDEFYEFLLSIFREEDVERHYKDDPRYPFACDFYIRSQDLFIELNLFFVHGFHWFNENDPADLETLSLWKERTTGKDLYSGAIYVWTVSDPQKRKTAQDNNLNYVVLWNLEDIERYKKELIERFTLNLNEVEFVDDDKGDGPQSHLST